MRTHSTERLKLESDLRMALEHGGSSGCTTKGEHEDRADRVDGGTGVLATPGRGLLEPEHFLPIAEETGFILPIGEWALKEACRQALAWQEQRSGSSGASSPRVCVNLSSKELACSDLPKKVVEGLEGDKAQPP